MPFKEARASIPFDTHIAKYELERFLLSGEFYLYEDDHSLGLILSQDAFIEHSYGKLILICRGESWSRAWRVTGMVPIGDRIRLICSSGFARSSTVLELSHEPGRQSLAQSRREFLSRVSNALISWLPNARIEIATMSRDDRNGLSGIYSRLMLRSRGEVIAAIGVSSIEPQSAIDAILGAGLTWLNKLERRGAGINRFLLVVPYNRATTVASRITMLRTDLSRLITLLEISDDGEIVAAQAYDQGDLGDRLQRVSRGVLSKLDRSVNDESRLLIESIMSISPQSITTSRSGNWINLSIRGLDFARISASRPHAFFGLGEVKERLIGGNLEKLEQLIRRIETERVACSLQKQEPLFRAYAERWLESLIKQNVSALDPTLDQRYCYSQVPAYRGEQRSFIDLLSSTLEGRLAVIELKVEEDSEFPFQGLDYWMRVEWHRSRGDFQKRGYFRGIELLDEPPLLFLVAPVFRFHATTRLFAGAIRPEVPVFRIGINGGWREQLRVELVERLN